MAATLLSGELSHVDLLTPASGRVAAASEALDQGAIADLRSTQISELSCDELVRVIQYARLPFLSDEACEHLPFHDRQTLERLANLAQRCCFNRTMRPGRPAGNTTYERPTFDA
jgi:hypothetical protein